ncbi:MAG: ATP synthase F1 subunit gamma [Acidimicrobiia bacterium]|nr:ATP synthase F1 subunit gamma [Acidimicrobiia bacterium]
MPGAELRLIRRRIRTVQSTMKITRAMEMIAASRIVRAQQRVGAGQPYAAKMREVVGNLSQASGTVTHPLLAARPLGTAGIMVVASDRGLAGAYNTNVIRLAEARLHEHIAAGVSSRLYVVGKRALTYFRYRRYHIERSFLGVTDSPTFDDAREIGHVLMADYEGGTVDGVEAFSTRYLSGLTQRAAAQQLLPLSPPEVGETTVVTYSYEPAAPILLAGLLPSYVEGAVFGILLEASASEHAARRRAMKAATENAEELTRILTRRANRARQAEITTEISEIVGGAEALTRG